MVTKASNPATDHSQLNVSCLGKSDATGTCPFHCLLRLCGHSCSVVSPYVTAFKLSALKRRWTGPDLSVQLVKEDV